MRMRGEGTCSAARPRDGIGPVWGCDYRFAKAPFAGQPLKFIAKMLFMPYAMLVQSVGDEMD
jgi:hypothetical protein